MVFVHLRDLLLIVGVWAPVNVMVGYCLIVHVVVKISMKTGKGYLMMMIC
jgi:hypothetical protein